MKTEEILEKAWKEFKEESPVTSSITGDMDEMVCRNIYWCGMMEAMLLATDREMYSLLDPMKITRVMIKKTEEFCEAHKEN